MSAQARFRFLAVLSAALVAGRGHAQTQNAVWTGAVTGTWSNPGNWTTSPTPGLFPNNGQPTAATVYNAQVTNGSSPITLDIPITINQLLFSTLTISGPTAGGPNLLTLNQSLAWNGGTFIGAISVQASGGATIAPSTGQTVLLDAGTLTLGGSNSTWSSGNITIQNGATFANLAGSVFTASGDGQFAVGTGPAPPTFNNAGSFTKSGGVGTTTVAPVVHNDGSIQGQTGTLQFTGPVTNTGVLFAAGGVLQLSGPLTNLSGGVLTGGTYRSSSNLVLAAGNTINTIAANTTVQLDGVNSQFAAVNPVSTVNGTFRLTNGRNFTTAGDLATSGTLDVQGSGSQFNVNGNLSVPSTGTANILNGVVGVAGTTSVAGTLNVGSGATLTGSQLLTVAAAGKLAVQGTVAQPVTAAGIVTGNAHFTNNLVIQPGAHLQPGNSPGTIVVSGNMTLNGNYDWDLNGNDNTMAGNTFDKVTVTGMTAIDPPAVNVDFGPVLSFSDPFWQVPRSWDILDTGSFSVDTILPDITTSDTSFRSIYPNGAFALSFAGNSLLVNWNPQGVPEPGSCALVGLAVAGWAARRLAARVRRARSAEPRG